MPVPLPPAKLQLNTMILQAGVELGRIHNNAFHATQFNPGKGRATRFAPIADASATPIPTLYAGTNFMCAVFEYIFHDIDPASAFKSVALSSIDPLVYSTIQSTRDLTLVRLFEPDLNKLKITRTDLIDTPPSTYGATKLWAEAIHAQSTADGLVWTSRRCDPEQAVILFGDRIGPSDLTGTDSRSIRTDVKLLDDLHEFAATAGITLTV